MIFGVILGYLPLETARALPPGEVRSLDLGRLRLVPGAHVTGRLVAPDGAQVPGQRVWLNRTDLVRPADGDGRGYARFDHTDEEGRFRIPIPCDGLFHLRTSSTTAGYLWVDGVRLSAAKDRDVGTLRCERLGELAGRVRWKTTGEPGRGRITVKHIDFAQGRLDRTEHDFQEGLVWASAETGEDGRFYIAGLYPGRYLYQFGAEGAPEYSKSAVWTTGDLVLVRCRPVQRSLAPCPVTRSAEVTIEAGVPAACRVRPLIRNRRLTRHARTPMNPSAHRLLGRLQMVMCLAGCVGLFLQWSFELGSAIGFRAWQGGAIGSLQALVVLFLFATEPIERLRAWRPVATCMAGASMLALFLVYVYWGGGLAWTRHPGPWVTLLATFGLLAAAAVEVRMTVSSRPSASERT